MRQAREVAFESRRILKEEGVARSTSFVCTSYREALRRGRGLMVRDVALT